MAGFKDERTDGLRGHYDSILSEAMRSALYYDTPATGISYFLSVLGGHIHCGGIYVYEEDPQNEIVFKSYEWIPSGGEPVTKKRQIIKTSILQPWKEHLTTGKPLVFEKIDSIKSVFPQVFKFLSSKDIHSLIVFPVIKKGVLSGFFGVDNPAEDEIEEITYFLSVVSPFLHALLKLRETYELAIGSTMLRSLTVLSEIYLSMHFINIKDDTFGTIKTNPDIEAAKDWNEKMLYSRQIKPVLKKECEKSDLKELLEFCDRKTMAERLKGKKAIEHEFLGKTYGYCRMHLIPADYDQDGSLRHVILVVEQIDEEKRRENYLRHLSQTDSMLNIHNRGSGEKCVSELIARNCHGLFCLLDCDRFKAINDTYGHLVGDKVLVAISTVLRNNSRSDDVVMRLGGDEFAVFYQKLETKKEAEAKIHKLFTEMSQIKIEEMGEKQFSVSLGATFFRGKKNCDSANPSFDMLYQQADYAMYQSKKNPGFAYSFCKLSPANC